ncbi:hypothetical protein JZ751_020181 [Albula glossodonta]|uniref:Zinc finger CCCH domain-containing protein 15 n=1 Tax=Albula glossodonta TaxID=121402 RepID=A0A8T2NX57_9TELE|nr:hypothetical protein JZ751_020181 [Albula glossodonta]
MNARACLTLFQIAASEGDKNKKGDKKKELSELNELFKPVVAAQKVSKGVDPKSVLCAFFKQGQCTKGDKCKFSHDLSLERKCEKRSVYVDGRDEDLEKGGDNCMYRHALPPGFVLKKDKKKEEEKEDEISLEELIENEAKGDWVLSCHIAFQRSALGPNVTRITLETFLAWKKRKRQEKVAKAEQDMEKKRADFKAGRSLGVSGREVFEFRPELVNDDDEEADDTKYDKEEDDIVEEVKAFEDIDVARFVPKEVDNAGITVAAADRFSAKSLPGKEMDDNKLSEASGGAEENGEHGTDGSAGEDEDEEEEEVVPVDENLFTGEDLEELEEELNTLDLED